MPLFKRKSASDQQTVERQALLDFLGVSDDGDALGEATYFACLKILSEAIGKMPFKIMRTTSGGGIETAKKHELYRLLAIRPNPYMTATHFWSTVEINRNHYGNAYVWITGAGKNTNLWCLPPESVEIYCDDKGIWNRKKGAIWYLFHNPKSGETVRIPHDSIMHFRTSVSFDGVTGLSVRDQLSTTLGGNMRGQKMLNEMYKNGFTAKAVLQYTGNLNDELEKRYTTKIEEYITGKVDTVKNLVPIPAGSTIQPLNMKLADNQFIELKKYSALQIAAAFGIKPNQINDYEKASYAAAEQQQLAFYIDTLLYILKQYEDEVTYKLLSDEDIASGYFAKFNAAVILRADFKTQLEAMATAVQNAIYTPNEARAYLDKGERPGGDQLICNGSMLPLTQAGIQYTKGGEKDEN